MPPCADTCMMPRPIEPVPTTATIKSEALGSKGMDASWAWPLFGMGRLTGKTRPCHALSATARFPARTQYPDFPNGTPDHADCRGGHHRPAQHPRVFAQA